MDKNATVELATVTIPAKGHTLSKVDGEAATCTEAGTKVYYHCSACGKDFEDENGTKELTTVTIPAKGHSMGDYTVYIAATCTEAGEERAYCAYCDYYESREISPLGHSFTDYVYDNNATYTKDGTMTARCDHPGCTETHTIPASGTRLPLYEVKGKDGARLPCREERQDGVLTITVDEEYASLTGSLSGIQALKAQGIDTIVFVTNGASSSFALSDLLDQGSTGDTYALTHDGSTVTFTIGNDTDISKILK